MKAALPYLIVIGLLTGPLPFAAATDPWIPPPPTAGPNGRFGHVDQAMAVKAPVWESERTTLHVQAGLRSELLPTDWAVLESSTPEQLRKLNLGLDGAYQFAPGWTIGGAFTLDSTSDRFDELTTLNAAVKAFVRLPAGERDAWTLSVAYSPLGQAIPTPTVSYSWVPSTRFSADVGLPVPLVYTPGNPSSDGRLELGTLTTITGQFRFSW